MHSVIQSFVRVDAYFARRRKWIYVFNFHFNFHIWVKFGSRDLHLGFLENRRRIGHSFLVAVSGFTFIREIIWPGEREDGLCEVCAQQYLHAIYIIVILGIILTGLRRRQESFLDSEWLRL